MLELYQQELEKQGLFNGEIPEIIQALAASINNYKIPYRMKLTIAVSEFITFFSQFHKHIKLPDGTIVPINSISFCISPSGTGKDSSKDAVRSCFGPAYQAINEVRLKQAKERAIQKADSDGVEDPHIFENYKDYYDHPQSLFSSPDSTIEGLIADFNGLQDEAIGSGSIYTGEIADEMGKGIADLMQFLSEVYDKGNKEVKKIKGMHKLKPLENFPVNALLMGSPHGIIYDPSVGRQFIKDFSTKLARRSFFMYAPDKLSKPAFKSINEATAWMNTLQDNAIHSRDEVTPYITEIGQLILDTDYEYVEVSKEAMNLFNIYKAYNEELSETIPPRFQISKLVREHLQWKSLKFAGAIALSKGSFEISIEDYIEAVTFAEMLNNDMTEFEKELGKEPYERFVDFMHSESFNNRMTISLHDLRKMGFIPTSGKPLDRIKELINLASSYDIDGIYTPLDDGIKYEKQQLTEKIGVSYLEVSGSKDQRAKQCASGFNYDTYTFADLGDMLTEDLAYSPFQFKDGIRGKDNIVSGCKWVVLDIDDSHITASEAHFLLSEINHHIALTSDSSNQFKFRVLIELDAIVDIPNRQWKNFILSISNSLSLTSDSLGKAQIFFSYSDREILSTIDADPLATKEHILFASQADNAVVTKQLTKKEKEVQLNDTLGTFEYAFEAPKGRRSLSLIRAAYHARELDMPIPQILELMDEINSYWLESLDEDEMERNIRSQIRRW